MITDTDILLPGRASKETQMATALNALQHGDPHHRAHALCWMTYRAINGDVSFHDWSLHALGAEGCHEAIVDPALKTRWMTSQRTAEFYLKALLLRTYRDPFDNDEEPFDQWLRLHPALIINHMRIQIVLAYRALLQGQRQECENRVMFTLQAGLRQPSQVPFDRFPLRIFEMRDDWHAFVCLMLIGQKHGFVPYCDAPWATVEMIERDDGHLPYVRCLKALGAAHPNSPFKLW